MNPEFSRPERVDTIGAEPRDVAIEAAADERRALAARFDVVGIDRLAATFTMQRDAVGIVLAGRVEGTVTQACSATGDPLAVRLDEPVALRFVEPHRGPDEAELGGDAIDTIEIEGDAIDLGEVAAETLALALDPFPRSPGAAAALKAAGVVSEEDAASPNAFAGLRAMLAKD